MNATFLKKLASAALVAIVFASGASAESGLRFGGRAGIAVGQIFNARGGISDTYGLGMDVGLAIERPFTNKLSLSTELNFYYRILGAWDFAGMEMEDDQTGDIWTLNSERMAETGLLIPLMLRYTPVERIPFYLSVGWQFGFPVNHRVEEDWTFHSNDGDVRELKYARIGEDRTLFDDGIAVEIGYMITPKTKIGFRYVYNLYPIYDTHNFYGDIKLQTFTLGITYFP